MDDGAVNQRDRHLPVMAAEVAEYLACRPGDVLVDCTVGRGGHALELLPRIMPGGYLIGIDRDGEAVDSVRSTLGSAAGDFAIEQANFNRVAEILQDRGISGADRILFDLGVSSPQLDNAERGFSFQADGTLDMRMDQRGEETAADLIKRLPPAELEWILRKYGEERWARRISRAIVRQRKRSKIASTRHLAEIVSRAVPGRSRIHPATRTFQALRIYLNREIESLEEAIPEAIALLKPKGRICVISFHSLEDRVVKHAFLRAGREERVLKILTRKPVRPGPAEIQNNRRARSARLRAAEKLDGTEER